VSWGEKITSDEQYLSELDASFVEAFKVARRAQAERGSIGPSDSGQAKPKTAESERIVPFNSA
jgi:hypothetical protein